MSCRRRGAGVVGFTALAVAWVWLLAIHARPALADGPRYTLAALQSAAERHFPLVEAAQYKLQAARDQRVEAHISPYLQFNAISVVLPVPALRGTSVFSAQTDLPVTDQFGIAWRSEISGGIPVWTFGKIGGLWTAAEAGVTAGEGEVRLERAKVRQDVRRAYYGLLLGRELRALIGEARDRLNAALRKVDADLEASRGSVTEVDRLRLRVLESEVRARTAQAERVEAVSRAALRTLTGVPGDIDLAEDELRPVETPTDPVDRYVDSARTRRPEALMLDAAVTARRANLSIARARHLPDILIVGAIQYAYSPVVDDQLNPFARDEANFFRVGLGAALRFNLDDVVNLARVNRIEDELHQTEAQRRAALDGMGLEARLAHGEIAEARRRVDAYQEGVRTSRAWLLAAADSFNLGTADARDLFDALLGHFQMRLNYLQAVHDLDVAAGALSVASGLEVP